MHWTGYFLFAFGFLACVYMAWRLTWRPQRSSKSGWQLIVVLAVLWAVMCSPGLLHLSSVLYVLPFFLLGEVLPGFLALELWSRQRLLQRLDGRPLPRAHPLWCLTVALSVAAMWVWLGGHIARMTGRYQEALAEQLEHGFDDHPVVIDYPIKLAPAIGMGVVASALIFGVLSLVRNAVGLRQDRGIYSPRDICRTGKTVRFR